MSSPLQTNITSLQDLLNVVNALPEEITLPELTNPADASKALSGYEFINEDCEKVTGTIPTKTASNLTASGATVTVPSGYYATQATKSVATATQATPSVSIDSAGKITASATQTAGYVSAGTKTGTKQLTTQAAKTVTPTKSSQTAVASGVYTTGAITVGAIPSQYVDNSSVTAVESDVMSGKKFGANGSVKTGTFSLDSELSTQDDLIAQIQTALQGKAAGGGNSDGSIEIGTIDGVTTLLDEPGQTTYYFYDLENIPNLSQKHIIVYIFDLPINSNVNYGGFLYRADKSDNFTNIYINKPGSMNISLESGTILCVGAISNSFSTITYYAK